MIVEYNIENEEGIHIQGKGNYCSELKKRKLKIKKLFKITILDEQEPSVQLKDRTKKFRKYVFTKTWKVAVTACIGTNK